MVAVGRTPSIETAYIFGSPNIKTGFVVFGVFGVGDGTGGFQMLMRCCGGWWVKFGRGGLVFSIVLLYFDLTIWGGSPKSPRFQCCIKVMHPCEIAIFHFVVNHFCVESYDFFRNRVMFRGVGWVCGVVMAF